VVPVELDRLLAGNCADILNEGARCQRRASCDAERSAAEPAVRQGKLGVRIPFTVVIFGQAPALAEFLEVRAPAFAVILERLWIAGERRPANAPLPMREAGGNCFVAGERVSEAPREIFLAGE